MSCEFPLSLSRRNFLKLSAAAGAAPLLWPFLSSSAARAADDLSASGVAARKAEFIRFFALEATVNDGIGDRAHPAVRGLGGNSWHNIYYVIPQLEQEKREPGSVTQLSGVTNYILPNTINFVNSFKDCSNFAMNGLLRILYLYPDSDLLGKRMLEVMRQAVLNFVYWIDEAKEHQGVMFTENHQIIFSTAELLAGQLYPDEKFTHIDGTGKDRIQRATPRILRWLDWRARFGFSEWLSNHYYEEDLIALFNLAQFAENAEIKRKSEDLISLMMFEMATNSLRGVFNPTQGRIYPGAVLNPALSFTSPVRWMLFDQGHYQNVFSMSAVSLATSPYVAPEVIVRIAHDFPGEMENRQRSSISFEEAGDLGIDPSLLENYPLFSGAGIHEHAEYAAILATLLPPDSRFQKLAVEHARHGERRIANGGDLLIAPNTLTTVHPYTFRTPDYQLSCAQDWRKGFGGYQQHIWTATLDETAQVFTTALHPENAHGGRVSSWAGNGSLPKAVAHKNVLLALYQITELGRAQKATHAWFPQFAFEEVREKAGWVFGRKGHGFVALRSLAPATWLPADMEYLGRIRLENPSEKPYDYQAEGTENAWICELGRESDWKSFDRFVEAISRAPVEGDTSRVTYQSPSLGKIETGWDSPLVVAGKEIEVHHRDRFHNPYCVTPFNTLQYTIKHGGETLKLDFAS